MYSFITHITIHFFLSTILPHPPQHCCAPSQLYAHSQVSDAHNPLYRMYCRGRDRGSLDASVGSWALTRTLQLLGTERHTPTQDQGRLVIFTYLIIALSTACPPGVPIYNCFVDPCTTASCPNYPQARCVSNYCGGCNYNFFDSAGTDVTDRCCKCLILVLVPRSSQLYKSFLPCACMRAQSRVRQLLCPSSLSVNLSVYLSLSLSAPEMTSSR